MAQSPSFERDLERLKQLSTDAFKGIEAAEAALSGHSAGDARLAAINFPLEEGLLGETIGLLDDCGKRAAKLIRDLDAAIAAEGLAFERLFDPNAGSQSRGLLRRPSALRRVGPEIVASGVMPLLVVLHGLHDLVLGARPEIARQHRQCEFHLLQVVERRQQLDAAIEVTSREIIELDERLRRHRGSVASARSAEALAASEQERKEILQEQQAARSTEETLASERETLMRLIEDVEVFLGALNAQLWAANVMQAKLAIDIEQGVALLKAAWEQRPAPEVAVPQTVAAMVSAFDANPLSGLGLFERKRAADGAFARRLDPAMLPVSRRLRTRRSVARTRRRQKSQARRLPSLRRAHISCCVSPEGDMHA